MKIKNSTWVIGCLVLFFSALILSCPTPEENNATVTEVTLNRTEAVVAVNGTVQLTATVKGSGSYDESVKWESSDPTIAEVDEKGKVTGKKVSDTVVTITATANGDTTKSVTAKITVVAGIIREVTLNQTEYDIVVDGTVQLTATVKGDGTFDESVKWESSDTTIADVDPTGKVTGKMVSDTVVTITAKANGDSTKSATAKITVVAGIIRGITLNLTEATTWVSGTVQLTATVQGDGNFDNSVKWESSASTIADVDTTGKVTGKMVSDTVVTITAKANGDSTKSATAKITVVAGIIRGITLNLTEATTWVSGTVQLTATVQGDGNFDNSVKWESSASTIADVDPTGKVTGKMVSDTVVTITAKANGDAAKSATAKITVVAGIIRGITLNLTEATTWVSGTVQLTATVQGDGNFDNSVKWESSASTIADVDTTGKVTGKMVSDTVVTITAKANGDTTKSATAKITVVATRDLSSTINFAAFDANGDENTNIYTHFLSEDYDPASPLKLILDVTLPVGVTVTPPLSDVHNYSDQVADIFTVTSGADTYKFRLHVIRKPILVAEAPKANLDYADYKKSGASMSSILKFVQTDYFYTPTMKADGTTPSDNAAPTFALFKDNLSPTDAQILDSSVKILRNFTTDDGTTLFFVGSDSLRAYRRIWPIEGLTEDSDNDFDVAGGLTHSTDYVLHWAMDASNGTFSGSLGTVRTGGVPATGSMAMADVGYFGWGGMTVHRYTGFVLPILYFSMDRPDGSASPEVSITVQVDNDAEKTLAQTIQYAIQQNYDIAYSRPDNKVTNEEGDGYYGNSHIVVTRDPEVFADGRTFKIKSTYEGKPATFTRTIVHE